MLGDFCFSSFHKISQGGTFDDLQCELSLNFISKIKDIDLPNFSVCNNKIHRDTAIYHQLGSFQFEVTVHD